MQVWAGVREAISKKSITKRIQHCCCLYMGVYVVIASVVITIATLLIFGYAKGYFTGNKPVKCAFQFALIGAIASATAFGMAIPNGNASEDW
ncbi:hypothetical protein GOBAR_DD32877 [Gossypium barbadense]|nr:hypothetical protein GOBAR_DD32877 [Gossypium barbadense]